MEGEFAGSSLNSTYEKKNVLQGLFYNFPKIIKQTLKQKETEFEFT